MSAFWALDYLCLFVIISCAALVYKLQNLNGAVMALSAMGTIMAVLFVVLAAPDDAQSEIVVGAIALPVLYLIAIGKIRADVRDRGELGEEGERGDD